jgi:hypothetical protein
MAKVQPLIVALADFVCAVNHGAPAEMIAAG